MSSTRKRQSKELDFLDEIQQPIANASLHGAITSLSPVKKGRNANYFEGTIADEHTKLRLVGFSTDQQRKLNTFFKSKMPINLKNCQVKESRQGKQMEVMLKSTTEIIESEKGMDSSTFTFDDVNTAVTITLSQLSTEQNFQRVNVKIKVIDSRTPCYVTGQKKKQDIIIADDTANAKLTVWEEHVDTFEVSKCYSLRNITVREYASNKYLSLPKEGFTITTIDDIGSVDDDCTNQPEQQLLQLPSAMIIGVPQLDSYKSCLVCKARVEPDAPEPDKPLLGRCTKCGMMQRFNACAEQLTAKLLVMQEYDGCSPVTKTLHAFGKIISDLLGATTVTEVTREALLQTDPVTITYNDKQVITAFNRM
jgi:hypothetical protein